MLTPATVYRLVFAFLGLSITAAVLISAIGPAARDHTGWAGYFSAPRSATSNRFTDLGGSLQAKAPGFTNAQGLKEKYSNDELARQEAIRSLKTFDLSHLFTNLDNPMMSLQALREADATLSGARGLIDETEGKLLIGQAAAKLRLAKIATFPKMRKAFASWADRGLGYDWVEVRTFGPIWQNVHFVDHAYHNAIETEGAHARLAHVLDRFRFKQACFSAPSVAPKCFIIPSADDGK